MSAGEYCNRDVVVVAKTDALSEAVKLMRTNHSGDVVVIEQQQDQPKPIGILTDRDIVMKLLARDVPLSAVVIGDVMSTEVVTVNEQTSLMDAVKTMRQKGIRRLPVVNKQGALVGILTVDDILELLAEQLNDIIGLLAKEFKREKTLLK